MTDIPAVANATGLGGRSLISSAWWMTGSHLLAHSFAYGSLILVAQWLPLSSFGTVAAGTGIVYVAALIVDRGTHWALVVPKRIGRSYLVRGFRGCILAVFRHEGAY